MIHDTDSIFDACGKRGQMAHFSARAGVGLAIEMQFKVRKLKRPGPIRFTILPQISEQIRHRRRPQVFGRAKRQAANRAKLLLELRGDAGVECEMAGIVRARREFVDETILFMC